MPILSWLLAIMVPVAVFVLPTPAAGLERARIVAVLEWAGFQPEHADRAVSLDDDGVLRVDLDALRSTEPDRFVPGVLNEALGQIRLANSSVCSIDPGPRLRLLATSRSVFAETEPIAIDLGTRSAEGAWTLDSDLLARFLPGLTRAVVLIQTQEGIRPIENWELRMRQALRRLERGVLTIDSNPTLELVFHRDLSAQTVQRSLEAMLGTDSPTAIDLGRWTDRVIGPVSVTLIPADETGAVVVRIVWKPAKR